jgi:hypothetical protein
VLGLEAYFSEFLVPMAQHLTASEILGGKQQLVDNGSQCQLVLQLLSLGVRTLNLYMVSVKLLSFRS